VSAVSQPLTYGALAFFTNRTPPAKNSHHWCEKLAGRITWSIFQRCKDPLEREFYVKMTKKFGWTKAVLMHQI
jgi:hypothetical protein